MFPDYNKEIRIENQSEEFTIPELITILDQLGKELSRDHITEKYAQYIDYVSKELREMRRAALEVAMDAEEEKAFPEPEFKKDLHH